MQPLSFTDEITTFKNARAYPRVQNQDAIQNAVFDENGAFINAAIPYRSATQPLFEPIEEPDQKIERELSGRYLYGGIAYLHFGHVLLESTSRLWALGEITPPDGMVFFAKRHQYKNRAASALQQRVFSIFGVDLPLIVLQENTQIEELIIPSQGLGVRTLTAGSPKMHHFVAQSFAARRLPGERRKLYISRSALKPHHSTVLEETMLEVHLAELGYEIFYPEQHSLQAQIDTYRSASHIIALDGSALHLAAFSVFPDTQVAIIKRSQKQDTTPSYVVQFENFARLKPSIIQHVGEEYQVPKTIHRITSIDLPSVQADLIDTGMIPASEVWINLSQAEKAELLEMREGKLGLRLLPLDRSIETA